MTDVCPQKLVDGSITTPFWQRNKHSKTIRSVCPACGNLVAVNKGTNTLRKHSARNSHIMVADDQRAYIQSFE